MQRISRVAATLLLCCSAVSGAFGAGSPGGPFDGEWSVVLVCADTQDKNGLVKGYEYTFRVTIADGKLYGQYGSKGAPASLLYSGEVGGDGTLEVRAVGNTGQSDRSVGRVARGTEYAYTMSGKLDRAHGQAVRRELRPCTATFDRL